MLIIGSLFEQIKEAWIKGKFHFCYKFRTRTLIRYHLFFSVSQCSSSSRGKHLVMLALNKQLKEKLRVVTLEHSRSSRKKIEIQTQGVDVKQKDRDPDYVPNSDNEHDNSSANESDAVAEPKQATSPTKKIHILSNVILNEAHNNANDDLEVDSAHSLITESTDTNHNNNNTMDIIKYVLQDIINTTVDKAEGKLYTKEGNMRKRRKFDEPPIERKRQKTETYRRDHQIKKPCKCALNCARKITYTRQKDINKQYWMLPKEQQKQFIFTCVKKSIKKKEKLRNKLQKGFILTNITYSLRKMKK